ncbi:MAG: methylenetetrahydrofolate reductase, partial [Planctomycetes bacterium]|nr:methylenetetrahydrofolate reductase [Planctomycetota bacterium]
MKIMDLFPRLKRTFSFEFFPPKSSKAAKELFETVTDLKFLSPDFVSVTYGAGGSTRQRTIELVARLKEEQSFNVMAHLTCVGHTKDELVQIIGQMKEKGIENILALRGDPPQGEKEFKAVEGGFKYASELVALIREIEPDICIGVAGCPEGHPDSPNLNQDIENLKR